MCVYIIIKKCVYTYIYIYICMYVCRGCLDKYISATTSPPPPPSKTKISGFTPGCHYFILEISTIYSLVILVVLTLFTCYLKKMSFYLHKVFY